MEQEIPPPWYKEGLHFKCTGCGKCCSGPPGYVWITEEEIAEIAKHLKLSLQEFTKKFVRKVNGKLALIEKKRGDDFDCIFLHDNRCTIYQARPSQCRTFPWWQQHLQSPETWNQLAKECEGIRSDADFVPFSKIKQALQD